MKHTTAILISALLLLACRNEKTVTVKFQVDFSDELPSIEDPSTIGIGGSDAPLSWSTITPLQAQGNGIYAIELTFPAGAPDTIEYQYVHSIINWENWDYGDAGVRTLIIGEDDQELPLVKYADHLLPTGNAKPGPVLLVTQPDTEEERRVLSAPFRGITADGQLETGLFSIQETGMDTRAIQDAVTAFLASLSKEQRADCTFPIDATEWRRWSNIDFYKRKGVGVETLKPTQKDLAFHILEESLSPAGLEKTQNIMKMEGYLARLANDFEKLGSELYWFTFMGMPSDTEPWGWQIDGHHLVINYFVLGDQVVMTPTFMGSEPNYIADGEHQGTRTFEREEQLGLQFYQSLSAAQRVAATLHDRKDFNYNQSESYSDNAVIPYTGLRASLLDADRQELLRNLIREYVGNMKAEHARVKMAEVERYLDRTYFSWVGGSGDHDPFYYRIHSPVILIEFDHQRPVFLEGNKPTKKHIHTVVRTPNGNDYGKDLLRQHLESHPH